MIKKLYTFFISPKVTLISWLFFLFSPILGIIRLNFLVNPELKGLHVNGLSTLLFYAPFVISAFVLLIIILWFLEFAKGRLTNLHQKVFALISVLTIISLVVSEYLINKEYITYPNYLYEHYGITILQLQLMAFVAALQVMIFLAFYVYKLTYKTTTSLVRHGLASTKSKSSLLDTLSFLVAVVGILSLFILSGTTTFEWPLLQRESKEGYEGKVGVDYKYIELLVQHTSDNIVVIHPPQGNKWPAIGNQPVLRYFLFPRILVSGALMTTQDYSNGIKEAYFVVIDPIGDREWPKINFTNKSVVFDETNNIKYKNLTLIFENDISKVYKIDFQ